uniref:Uncharacterized protein n=1 Tax=Periophthalmus magnuspinnatus TaxID=409849 RepID=A0A3B3ZLJ7_9GOBI
MLLHVMFLGLTAAASVSAASVSAAAVSACEGLSLFSTNTEGCLKQLKHMVRKYFTQYFCSSVESQLTFVHKNLQHIFHLYRHGNLTRLGWDATGFLSALHRQLSCLRPCVSPAHNAPHTTHTNTHTNTHAQTHKHNPGLLCSIMLINALFHLVMS